MDNTTQVKVKVCVWGRGRANMGWEELSWHTRYKGVVVVVGHTRQVTRLGRPQGLGVGSCGKVQAWGVYVCVCGHVSGQVMGPCPHVPKAWQYGEQPRLWGTGKGNCVGVWGNKT